MAPGKEASIALDFSPPARGTVPSQQRGQAPDASKSSTSATRTLGWVAVGAGGVGVALGSVMGAMALNKRASLRDSGCTESRCPHDKQSEVDRLNTFRTVSTVGFIAGGVLASTGVVLLLSAPSSEHQLAAVVSRDSVTLTGRF